MRYGKRKSSPTCQVRRSKRNNQPHLSRQMLGVTKPICVKPSQVVDLKTTENLRERIKEANLTETREQASQREIVLLELNEMAKQWAQKVTMEKRAPESEGILYTYGSYRLGVHTPGADIDVLCVGSRHITYEDFFDSWVSLLRENRKVLSLLVVPEAHVPVCKFKFNGVDIDMVYVQVGYESISGSSFDIFDDNNLQDMEMKSVNSLNGARVAQGLLNLVPNTEAFIEALRVIKYWAKCRGIYSNVMGYLGGVSWAILVARVCQLFPNQCAGSIVVRFFRFYNIWQFGVECPILLTKPKQNDKLGFEVWDPNNPQVRNTRMAIITPCYPAINSTFRVTTSNYMVIKDEFRRAKEITTPGSSNVEVTTEMWREVFKEKEFFFDHEHYILIRAMCMNTDKKDIQTQWKGFVQAKVRVLVLGMEQVAGVTVFPYPYSFHRKDKDETSKEDYTEDIFFIGFNIEESLSGTKLNFSQPVRMFKNQVNSNPLALQHPSLKLVIEHKKVHKLPDFCFKDKRRPKKKKRKKPKPKAVSCSTTEDEMLSGEHDVLSEVKCSPGKESVQRTKNGDDDFTLKKRRLDTPPSQARTIKIFKDEKESSELVQGVLTSLPPYEYKEQRDLAILRLRLCLKTPDDGNFWERTRSLTVALLDVTGADKKHELQQTLTKFGYISRSEGFENTLTRSQCIKLSKAIKAIFRSTSSRPESKTQTPSPIGRPDTDKGHDIPELLLRNPAKRSRGYFEARLEAKNGPGDSEKRNRTSADKKSPYSQIAKNNKDVEDINVKVLSAETYTVLELDSCGVSSKAKRPLKRYKKTKRLISIT